MYKLSRGSFLMTFFSVLNCLFSQGSSSGEDVRANVWFVQNDPSWTEKLSQPRHEIKFEFDVKVPMRDGVRLSANIWRPKTEGKFPVIFMYNPYDNASSRMIKKAKYFVPRGYVFAAIDVRGRYDSPGASYLYWDPGWREGKFDGQDIYDCQTWLGEQPWSAGKIGMTGGSYQGFVQWMGATLRNPYLTALVPYVSPDDHYDNVFPNGAFQLSNSLNLLAILGNLTSNNSLDLRAEFWDWQKLYRHLPLRTMDEALFGQKDILWQDLVDHPDNDHYWRFSVGDRPGPGKMSAENTPRSGFQHSILPGGMIRFRRQPSITTWGWFVMARRNFAAAIISLWGPGDTGWALGRWGTSTMARKQTWIFFPLNCAGTTTGSRELTTACRMNPRRPSLSWALTAGAASRNGR